MLTQQNTLICWLDRKTHNTTLDFHDFIVLWQGFSIDCFLLEVRDIQEEVLERWAPLLSTNCTIYLDTHTHTRHDTTLLNTWYRLPQRPASARFSSAHFSALIISLVRSTCRYLHPLELNTQNFIISPSPIKIKQKVRRYALLPGTGWRCIPSGHRRPAEEPIYWSYGSFRSHGYCPSHRNHRPQKVPFYDNCSTYLCCVVLQICMIG